jgi:hypothetical protein
MASDHPTRGRHFVCYVPRWLEPPATPYRPAAKRQPPIVRRQLGCCECDRGKQNMGSCSKALGETAHRQSERSRTATQRPSRIIHRERGESGSLFQSSGRRSGIRPNQSVRHAEFQAAVCSIHEEFSVCRLAPAMTREGSLTLGRLRPPLVLPDSEFLHLVLQGGALQSQAECGPVRTGQHPSGFSQGLNDQFPLCAVG